MQKQDPPTQIVCETGAHSDGAGNCVPDSIPVICDTDYHSDGNGNCVPLTVSTPSVCPYGYLSDGNGNCVPEDSSLTSCASGFETDN
jgi:hypothetical protein